MVELIEYKTANKKELVKRIKAGDIFVFPTESSYCIGCSALKQGSVAHIRELKGKKEEMFSIIAPNKKWISKYFKIQNYNYVDKLPGPFTFVLEMKKRAVSKAVNAGSRFLGVKIPDHDFNNLIKEANIPFVIAPIGLKPIREVSKIPKSIMKNVDFVLDDGFLGNYPSAVIDLTGIMPRIVR